MAAHGDEASNSATLVSDTKAYVCVQCPKPKRYTREGNYNNHMNKHHRSSERPDPIDKDVEQSLNSSEPSEKSSKGIEDIAEKLGVVADKLSRLCDQLSQAQPRLHPLSHNHDAQPGQAHFPPLGSPDMFAVSSHPFPMESGTPYQPSTAPQPGFPPTLLQRHASVENTNPSGASRHVANHSVPTTPNGTGEAFDDNHFLFSEAGVDGLYHDFPLRNYHMRGG